MGLFSFVSESGKGCTATISSDQLVVEVINFASLVLYQLRVFFQYSLLPIKFVLGWSIYLCFLGCSQRFRNFYYSECGIGTKISSLSWLQSINTKRQITSLKVQLQTKRWYHICVTHNTQRALNGGNTIKVYIDGVLASSERLRSAILPAVELKRKKQFEWYSLGGSDQDLCRMCFYLFPVCLIF